MKILRLDVTGYRSLKKISWEPGDLNILIGPNGSGKTVIVQPDRTFRWEKTGKSHHKDTKTQRRESN